MARIFIVVFFILLFKGVHAQFNRQDFDSFGVKKPREAKLLYEVEHPMFQEISVKFSDPKVDKTAKGSFGGYVGRNFMASVLGNWSSSRETNLLIPAQLKTEPEGYGWNVDIYLNGELEKNTERVRNSDGSRSTSTTRTVHMHWRDGAWGNIIDRVDTIGAFILSIDPLHDSALADAYKKVKEAEPRKEKEEKRRMMIEFMEGFNTERDFGLFGNFKEASFTVLYSWQTNGGYIFMNGRLDAVVYTDDEAPGSISFKSRSKRVPPKLLIRKGLTQNQQADLIRMALVCKLFAQITRVDAKDY
jgi:hypothetical protein